MPRKTPKHIKVWVSDSDDAAIRKLAAASGLSLSAYLRHSGLNKKVRSIIDMDAVRELSVINGKLGEMAETLDQLVKARLPVHTNQLIKTIRDNQTETHNIMGKILR
ncbi:MAG: hypothetical protein ABI216_21850 [Devosia sp.]